MPGRGRLSRARAIAGAGCGRPSRARPSIAGLGCAHRGRWVRPSVAGAGCSRPSRARAAPLRARIENACTTSSNMACAIVGACLRLVDFMQRLQLPRQVRFWFCLLRSSTHEENTLQGAGCVDRGRTLQLSRAVLCPGAAVYHEPGLRPSRARVAAVHRGRGLLHCGRGLRMLAQHQATWPVRLSALAFAWWTLCNGCNYLGRSGFGSVFCAVARTKKTRCKARDASIAGAHCSCHEQCCARARQSITSPGCAHRGRGSQPSIAGAGCSIASAVYSCPEQC